jgi:hypothetical protein
MSKETHKVKIINTEDHLNESEAEPRTQDGDDLYLK